MVSGKIRNMTKAESLRTQILNRMKVWVNPPDKELEAYEVLVEREDPLNRDKEEACLATEVMIRDIVHILWEIILSSH